MTVLLGALLGAGLLLTLAPWMWPAHAERSESRGIPRLERLIEDAGVTRMLSVRMLVAITGVGAIIVAALTWLLFPTLPLWVLTGVGSALVPVSWLQARVRSRRQLRRNLWPDVCDLLISAVRSGMSLPAAVASLATTAPESLRPEFATFARDLSATTNFDSSMARLKTLLADPVADRIVETLRMAREVGGTELVPTLRALSISVRADATLRAEVEAKQSWIRAAAWLGAAAPWVILVMLALRPEGAQAYASPGGIVLILCGAAATVVAFRLMLRIGRLAEPRRWFA